MSELEIKKTEKSGQLISPLHLNQELVKSVSVLSFIKAYAQNPQVRIFDAVQDKHNIKSLEKSVERLLQEFYLSLGLKQPLNEQQKEDLKETIFSTFSSLSLTEVAYAFKAERTGAYEDPIEHYGALTPAYIGKVLRRYKKSKMEIKRAHNITESINRPDVHIYTEEEKADLINSGLARCFNEFKETKEIGVGYPWVYNHLNDSGILSPTVKERKAAYAMAKRQLARPSKMQPKTLRDFSAILEEKRRKHSGNEASADAVVALAKNLILVEFFDALIRDGKHLQDVL